MVTRQEDWEEELERLDYLAEIANQRGYLIGKPVKPPKLTPDGGLASPATNYDPNQPRDDHGRFGHGEGGGHEPMGHGQGKHAAHELEHTSHEAHTLHEAHEVGEVLGGGHDLAHAAVGEAAGHAAEHGAHAAEAAGHGAGEHVHGPEDAAAIVARNLYGPALSAVSKILTTIPGARAAGEALSNIHTGMSKWADSRVEAMSERYGRATTAAVLGAGALLTSHAALSVGIPGWVAKAGPQKLLGTVALMTVGEAGKRLGLLGQDSKLEKAVRTGGTWIHAIKEAVAKPFRAVGRAAATALKPLAEELDETYTRTSKAAGKLAKRAAAFVTHAEGATPDPRLVKRLARELMTDAHKELARLLRKYGAALGGNARAEDDDDEG